MERETVEENQRRCSFRSCCCCCCPCFKKKKKQHESLMEDDSNSINPEYGAVHTTRVSFIVGSTVTIEGTVHKKCKRFSINLNCSFGSDPNIALHFNPRMEQRYVVRNCRLNGRWGDEETSSNMPFLFQKDKDFTVDIFAAERQFMISVNGEDWCAFTYRIPLEQIVVLEVRGLVDLKSVNTKIVKNYPENVEPIPILIGDDTVKKMHMPFLGKLPRAFDVGWEIDIFGKTKLLPQMFFINLQDSQYLWPHPNIPLHLNPRFCTMNGVDVFARNAWYDGTWGAEERAPICPFLAGNEFIVKIRHEYNSFTVWTGEKMIADFQFRGSINKIMYVYIAGDLEVYNVSLNQRDRTVTIEPLPKSQKSKRLNIHK